MSSIRHMLESSITLRLETRPSTDPTGPRGTSPTVVSTHSSRSVTSMDFSVQHSSFGGGAVGERGSYGLLTGMFDLVAQPSGTWPLIRSSFKGKWAGLRAYREAR